VATVSHVTPRLVNALERILFRYEPPWACAEPVPRIVGGCGVSTASRPVVLKRTPKVLFLVALLLMLGSAACAKEPRVVLHTDGGAVSVPVEVVDTPAKRNLGLMYRKDLAPEAGMLFIFERMEPLTFWMKNTPLPLDMIFIGDDRKIVGIVKDAVPFTETPRRVDGPSRYVLEVNAGFSERHKLKAGDSVTFEHVPRLSSS